MNKRPVIIIILLLASMSIYSQVQQNFYDINTVQEIRITFNFSGWKHKLDSLFQLGDGKTRLMGNVQVNGQTYTDVGVRYKGFSSWDVDYIKNPFCVYLDHTITNRNYQGFTTIKLSNVIHDPSFVREALSYEIARKYMPASLANFAALYINDTLIGLYTNVESVDEHFTDKFFGSHNHSFFKGSPANLEYPFGQNANLAYTHGTDSVNYMPYYECESDNGWGDLLRLISILNTDTANIDSVLNVDRALWMHAFNYTLVNLDSYIGYCQNYYLYLDDNLRFNAIPWDMNMSFGSFRHSDGNMIELSIAKTKQVDPLKHLYGTTFSPRPLTKNLFANSTYRKMYLAHMRTIINENFRNNEYFIRAQQMQSAIDSFVLNDPNKFYSYTDFINNLNVTTGASSDQYPGLKDLMEARIAYLDTFPGLSGEPYVSQLNHLPPVPGKGEEVWITAKVSGANNVLLGYRNMTGGLFKRTEMFDDGAHDDGIAGDSIYGASLLVLGSTVQYYIWAENNTAGAFSPERAEYEFYSIQPRISHGDIAINEFMAVNDNSLFDQDGENDSWIEIYNSTSEDMELSGLNLSDERENTTKWGFPDTSIQAKGFLIVWADNDVAQAGLHANFDLPADAGNIFLGYNNNELIDSVYYDEQSPAKTFGRYPNGYGEFVFMQPSFSKNNLVGTPGGAEFGLYPNPASDEIIIEVYNENNPVSLEMFNSAGQRVINESYEFSPFLAPAVSKSLDVSGLHKGIYLVRLQCAEKTMNKKLIIY